MTTRVLAAVRARLGESTDRASEGRIETGEYLIAGVVALGLVLALFV